VQLVLSKWSATYNANTGNVIRYQSIGSSAGIAKIKASAVDFGASDMPIKSDELIKLGLPPLCRSLYRLKLPLRARR
jgi:phosphate transport system substrate-binding protein